jgi:Fe-S-cluster-containing hydrogenase component 2
VLEYELVINYDKCTGCRICELACSLFTGQSVNPRNSRIHIVKLEAESTISSFPVLCVQCAEPVCESICFAGAISTNPSTGAKIIDIDKCFGCNACVYACPYGAIFLNRSLGIAVVCNRCNGSPLCVKMCPFEALQYIPSDVASMKLRRNRLRKVLEEHT